MGADPTDATAIRVFGDTSKRGEAIAVGYCLKTWQDGGVTVLEQGGKELAENMTVNQGEYEALVYGIEKANEYDFRNITLHSDARSVVRMIRQKSRRKPHRGYIDHIHALVSDYDSWRIFSVSREGNEIAHKESRKACSTVGQSPTDPDDNRDDG